MQPGSTRIGSPTCTFRPPARPRRRWSIGSSTRSKSRRLSSNRRQARSGLRVRYLILSDLHANVHALDAVLVDAAAIDCDRILCLGDLVGYGADPAAVV